MSLRHRCHEAGQSALILVLILAIIISVGGGILADTVVQHDPLVHHETVKHFSYRALEAGINTFVSDANADPNELTCNSTSPSGGECDPTDFNHWKRVNDTTGTAIVPEYYAWGNPKFCFTRTCPIATPTARETSDTAATTHTPPIPILYVKETVYGAAGVDSDLTYQQSTLNLTPVNGFLTRIWWSTYEADDPLLMGTPYTPPHCTYNWANGYSGPNTTSSTECSPVVFASGTQVYGPIYSNDSIYITGKPTLGPTQTADPSCLFVQETTDLAKSQRCITKASQGPPKTKATRTVTQTTSTFNTSKSGATVSRLPKTDDTLEQFAHFNGCVYTGPTTIEFDATDMMTVWSKETPERPATPSNTKPECPSTHTSSGATATTTQHTTYVPNGVHGGGVIYVESKTTASPTACTGANPFGATTAPTHAQFAQDSAGKYHYDYFGAQPFPQTNCEGDAFVSDNPSGGGIKGQLTVAAANDVVITGTIKYKDCGALFQSTHLHTCKFNATGTATNDSLGLIAQNYVLVNHPVKAVCVGSKRTPTTGKTVKTCNVTASGTSAKALATACPTTVLGTPQAAVCNPVTSAGKGTTPQLTIDAAVLALNHSFTVDNEGIIKSTKRVSFGLGSLDGTLKVYGSIDQKWRGTVGIVGTSGYVKNYDWNSIGAVITPPHYLAPGTPSWAIGSSAVVDTAGRPLIFTAPRPSDP